MFFNAILILSVFLQAGNVLGHGFVRTFIVGGRRYGGNQPAESHQRNPSPIRQIANTLPVKGSWNPDIVCGRGATNAAQVADVNPGDEVQFDWSGAGYTPWPHNTGPIITYMASCGSVSCDKFNPSGAQWFKISNLVKKSNGEWHQADVQRGVPMKVRIPSGLAAGNYLIRQEIIALHLATTNGGAEFYPSCTQLRVGGSETGRPAQGDLVTFPGAYYDEHPGLWVRNLYQHNAQYEVPGPAIAKIAAGNAAPAPAPPPASTTTSTPTSTPTPTSTRTTSTATKTSTSTSTRTVTSTAAPSTTSSSVRPTSSQAPVETPMATVIGDLPIPVANAAKPPSTTSAALVTAPSPEVTRLCRRRRSSLKYMQAKLAKRAAESAPVPAPLRSRHSRRAAALHHRRMSH